MAGVPDAAVDPLVIEGSDQPATIPDVAVKGNAVNRGAPGLSFVSSSGNMTVVKTDSTAATTDPIMATPVVGVKDRIGD